MNKPGLREGIWATGAAILLVSVLFTVYPQIDIAAARWFYRDGFAGAGSLARGLRGVLYAAPLVVAVGFLLAKLLPLPGAWGMRRRPSWRQVAFLTLAMALGPGLLVNIVLKDHWHRPRPVQTREFGGAAEFRPVWRMDGACAKNCSFVSGETSAAFWLVAPALLAPTPWQGPALAAALATGVLTGVLRMALGGHYLSDVLLAGLLTLLVVLVLRALLFARLRDGPPQL